ncbi:MAG: OmpA family protein, partial [Acidobacteriaceae bacterium]|nr:OmpA family protein [Acidobacteriaceae bacterium]
LTAIDKKDIEAFAAKLDGARHYILEVTGGTDSTGDPQYNYDLSQRRADAVVNYLQTKYNVAPHKFYLIGIGKDQEVASNKTAAGRKQNRRVAVRLMSNMKDAADASAPSGTK